MAQSPRDSRASKSSSATQAIGASAQLTTCAVTGLLMLSNALSLGEVTSARTRLLNITISPEMATPPLKAAVDWTSGSGMKSWGHYGTLKLEKMNSNLT